MNQLNTMGFMSSFNCFHLRLVEGGNDELGLAKMVVTLLPGDEGYVIALAQVPQSNLFDINCASKLDLM